MYMHVKDSNGINGKDTDVAGISRIATFAI